MKVSHKIKLFTWRACKDGLPSLTKVQQKKVQTDLCCIFYKALTKDFLLAVFLCPEEQQWWRHFLPLTQNMSQVGSLLELALRVKTQGITNKLDTFFVIASYI